MNNMVPNNNSYYEPKKSNSTNALLIVLILLVLCLIGLTCYKMFVYDKKDNNKPKENNTVVDNGNTNNNNNTNNTENGNTKEEEKNNEGEPVNISNAEAQKYYTYVSSDRTVDYNSSNEVAYDFNYYNNNKNYVAYDKIISENTSKYIKTKGCKQYADKIMTNSNGKLPYICYTDDSWDQSCEAEYNTSDNAKVYVLDDESLKNAVETIYGKGSYVAKTFYLGGTELFQYIDSSKEYINLTGCGGGADISYQSKLDKYEASGNYLYIYEKVSAELEDGKKYNVDVKHTFEKNTYDDNYHYVKSEKA